MPDAWGRLTPNEWMGLGSQALNIAGNIQRNRMMANREQFNQSVDAGLTALQTGGIDTEKPEGVGGRAWSKSRNMFFTDQKEEEEYKVREEAGKIGNLIAKNGIGILENLPEGLGDGYIGLRAQSMALEKHAESAEGIERMSVLRKKTLDREYPTFLSAKNFINNSLQSGDTEAAAKAIISLSSTSLFPHELGAFNPETKTFKKFFKEDTDDTPQEIGEMSLGEVADFIDKIEGKEYFAQMLASMEATRLQNHERVHNPIIMKNTKDGSRYKVIPRVNPHDRTDVHYIVFGPDGKEQMANKMEELYASGLEIENLQEEKTRAQIGKEQAHQGLYSAQAQAIRNPHEKRQPGGTGGITPSQRANIQRHAWRDAEESVYGQLAPYQDLKTGQYMDPASEQPFSAADIQKRIADTARQNLTRYLSFGGIGEKQAAQQGVGQAGGVGLGDLNPEGGGGIPEPKPKPKEEPTEGELLQQAIAELTAGKPKPASIPDSVWVKAQEIVRKKTKPITRESLMGMKGAGLKEFMKISEKMREKNQKHTEALRNR